MMVLLKLCKGERIQYKMNVNRSAPTIILVVQNKWIQIQKLGQFCTDAVPRD